MSYPKDYPEKSDLKLSIDGQDVVIRREARFRDQVIKLKPVDQAYLLKVLQHNNGVMK